MLVLGSMVGSMLVLRAMLGSMLVYEINKV